MGQLTWSDNFGFNDKNVMKLSQKFGLIALNKTCLNGLFFDRGLFY